MKISNNKHLNILDVPNEILLIIFNNLNVVDVLYSLVNVTQRFDQLILEPFYTHSLDMTSMTMKSYFDRIYSIDSQLLDRICQNILPRIHRQVHELIVEQHSMAQVIHTINYPQLLLIITYKFSRRNTSQLFNSFSIDTNIVENNIEIDLSSNEDIQRSVIRKEYGPVHSYVETFSQQNEGRADSYSLPYQFKWFHYLNNSFQVGIFNSVQSLMMTDDLNPLILNNSIGAPTPKSVPSETAKTSVSLTTLIIPDWVHCEICKRREHNGLNNTRLPLGYSHPCGHFICRDCAIHNMNGHNCKYIKN
ncbi:unnamed protein product [Rotaria magnacalcarata]|uniref:F-box domain-containing protein n=2 Tax=Rotaria magnacalcarata TaxID=392030 RepID=A0A815U8A2_9BILA|nr:unnamed protein product [Rotaria magnacalcarata]